MRFLEIERATCEAYVPGLLARLAELPLAEKEAPGGPTIDLFRAHGGTNLLVPAEWGGAGASALDAARVVRALGSTAPSLAVGTMMHHFSLGSLLAVADLVGPGTPLDGVLAEIAADRLLLASGFAEGQVGRGILAPGMRAEPVDGGYLVNGSKKPCSLSRSMNLLTASVEVGGGMGLLLLPAGTPGLSVHPFWGSPVLAGAESDEIRLTDVFVTDEQLLRSTPGLADRAYELQTVGLVWFQMIVCAAYTGIVSALVDRVLARGRGDAALVARVESAAALTEGLARRIDLGDTGNDALAAALVVRHAVREALTRTVDDAVELLGGMAFVSSPDVAYLAAASHAVAFHPPSRAASAERLLDYYAGHQLVIA
jgi:alkylation response protein AidB-like acyl-CoA dehydrogenase